MSRKYTIYALLAPDSDEVRYIGITVKPIKRRLQEHILAARRGERTYRACWIRSIAPIEPDICEVEQTEDREREKYWIKEYRKIGHCLTNLTAGGDGAPPGLNFTPEHRAKISAALKGRPKSDEHRKKLSEAKKGSKHSEKTRKKISNIVRGRVHKEETKKKIAASHIGITHTENTKKKLSETRRHLFAEGKLVSPTQGKHHSEDTKKKLSEATKRHAAIKQSLREQAYRQVELSQPLRPSRLRG